MSSVKVAVRIRPLSAVELENQCRTAIDQVSSDRPQIVVGTDTYFTFDFVFSWFDKQEKIYDDAVHQLVQAFFEGFNATVLAYGQTGSGKTYTMGSASNVQLYEEAQGIIPRVVATIFERIKEDETVSWDLTVSFLEIYGEDIRDLLSPIEGTSSVTVRENRNGEVCVSGETCETVHSEEETMMVLEKGSLRRTTATTMMNATSSRSHAIVTLTLTQRITSRGTRAVAVDDSDEHASVNENSEAPCETETRRSKFHFVDLAGSERAKRTKTEGRRFQEGVEINKGLLVLGNVISALGDETKRGKVHVPYRDSKLTRLLQDSLGGNSQTLFICCVSPADVNMSESLSALRYANRARNIENKPVVNRDAQSNAIMELRRSLHIVGRELYGLKHGVNATEADDEAVAMMIRDILRASAGDTERAGLRRDTEDSFSRTDVSRLRKQMEESDGEMKRLIEVVKKERNRADEMSDKLLQVTAERDLFRMRSKGECVNGEEGEELSVIQTYLGQISNLRKNLDTSEERRKKLEDQLLQGSRGGVHSGRGLSVDIDFEMDGDAIDPEDNSKVESMIQKVQHQIEEDERRLAVVLSSIDGDQPSVTKGEDSPGEDLGEVLKVDSLDSPGADVDGSESALDEETVETAETVETSLQSHDALSSQMESRRLSFKRRHYAMTSSVTELSENIKLKEELVTQLRIDKERFDQMKSLYESKLAEMDLEVQKSEKEREALVEEIENLEKQMRRKGSQSSSQENRNSASVVKRLKAELKEKEVILNGLKRKQNELTRISAARNEKEERLNSLSVEIKAMKKQRVDLMRKMDKERKKHAQEMTAQVREILKLRREATKNSRRIERLGTEKAKADLVARRHLEEISMLRRRQNTLQNRMKSSMERNRKSPAQSTGTTNPILEKTATKWIRQKLEELTKREQGIEHLAIEYERLSGIQSRRKDVETAKGNRGAKDERDNDHENSEEIDAEMECLMTEVKFKKDCIHKMECKMLTEDVQRARNLHKLNKQHPGDHVWPKRLAIFTEEDARQIFTKFDNASLAQVGVKVAFLMVLEGKRSIRDLKRSAVDARRHNHELSVTIDDLRQRQASDLRRYDLELTKIYKQYEEKISTYIEESEMNRLLEVDVNRIQNRRSTSPQRQLAFLQGSKNAAESLELDGIISPPESRVSPRLSQRRSMSSISDIRFFTPVKQKDHVEVAMDAPKTIAKEQFDQQDHSLVLRLSCLRSELLRKQVKELSHRNMALQNRIGELEGELAKTEERNREDLREEVKETESSSHQSAEDPIHCETTSMQQGFSRHHHHHYNLRPRAPHQKPMEDTSSIFERLNDPSKDPPTHRPPGDASSESEEVGTKQPPSSEITGTSKTQPDVFSRLAAPSNFTGTFRTKALSNSEKKLSGSQSDLASSPADQERDRKCNPIALRETKETQSPDASPPSSTENMEEHIKDTDLDDSLVQEDTEEAPAATTGSRFRDVFERLQVTIGSYRSNK